VAPLAPGRYAFQFTGSQDTYEKLRYAQALLGHVVPSGELAEVFNRALDALIVRLEQRKFAATPRPRRRRSSANPRHVPAEVRRAVWARDDGQCTFVSAAGHRCPSRTRLEFDHVDPVARGGRATVERMRLRCRAHNQYAAERAFGADFMSHKREAAKRAADAALSRAAATEEARALAAAATDEARALAAAVAEETRVRAVAAAEVVPWLRRLGLRVDEARRAAARCEALPDAPLEERVRCALSGFARPSHRCAAAVPRPARL
jgi:5-methylcytosine-specific restriction endonuclease McrA